MVICMEPNQTKKDFVFDGINGIAKVLKYPGELFKINVFYGVAFMGVLGTIIAVSAIALGY